MVPARGLCFQVTATALALCGSATTSRCNAARRRGSGIRPIRCQTESSPLRVRGRDNPSWSFRNSPRSARRSVWRSLPPFWRAPRNNSTAAPRRGPHPPPCAGEPCGRPVLDGDGPLGVEAAGALAVTTAVAVVAQPGHAIPASITTRAPREEPAATLPANTSGGERTVPLRSFELSGRRPRLRKTCWKVVQRHGPTNNGFGAIKASDTR